MSKIFLWIFTFSWALFTLYLTTIPNFSPAKDTILSWILSNGGHFSFFGVQASLLYVSLIPKRDAKTNSIIITSLFGLMIELIQRSIPGRSFGISDWILDTLGAICFVTIVRKISNQKFSKNKI